MSQLSSPEQADREILSLIDLERYPIADMESPGGRAFVERCARHMKEHGWCSLDGFIRPEALQELAGEATELLPGAAQLTITRNIYGHAADAGLPAGNPARHEISHNALQLADDQIGTDTLVKRLYHCAVLTEFVARVQGKSRLFVSGDEFQALNIVALQPGEWQGWHYDHDECVVTLLLQSADAGGEFLFLPNCRTRETEDTEMVERLIGGDTSAATSFGRSAGTLTMFRGEFSLHGVSRVEGTRPRITAIFTYDDVPNRVSTDDINIRIYGERVERILNERA
ncbi:MAG: hypothetical protein AAF441_08800 [Pseudomonadota bacterium]